MAAVFGEDCQHHFGKLHRFCEVRTLTDELLDELCENVFIQVSLAGETKKYCQIDHCEYCGETAKFLTYKLFTLESNKLWIKESTASLQETLNVILRLKEKIFIYFFVFVFCIFIAHLFSFK